MKKSLIGLGILCGATVLSGFCLSRFPSDNSALAETASTSLPASVSVASVCTLSGNSSTDGNSAHSATLTPGIYTSGIGQTTLTVSCNDASGWALYAIGDGSGTDNNALVHASDSSITISTGTATSGDSSAWAMMLQSGSGTNSDGTTGPIASDFSSYAAVPSTNTKVASLDRDSSSSSGASVATTYAAYVSAAQAAGTYNGAVKYTLTNPSTNIVCDDGYENVNGTCQQPTMQTFSCSSLASGATTTLYDSRDGEAYLVGKLADGKCWMLDNLRLGGSSAITLTSSDSNVSSNYTLPASGTWTSSSQNSYTASYINASYKNNTTTSYGSGSGKIGVYYNYCAASAGTICSSSNSSNASYDICPKGWRLPTGGSSGEFQALYTAYSSNVTTFRSALSTPLSGRFYSGSANSQGSYGRFWSSTLSSSTYMYSLSVDSSNVYPANDKNRYNGYSIRCVSQ